MRLLVILGLIIFISSVMASDGADNAQRKATILAMQRPLRALVDAIDTPPLTPTGAHPLDTRYDPGTFANTSQAFADYYARMTDHAVKHFVPRSHELIGLVEDLWSAAGGLPLTDERKTYLSVGMAALSSRGFRSKTIETVRGGRVDFATIPFDAFTDVRVYGGVTSDPHPSGALTLNDFQSLVQDSLIYAVKNCKNLEEILPYLNATVSNLSGFIVGFEETFIAEQTPAELYSDFDGQHLLALFSQAAETVKEQFLTSTSVFWHNSDLPPYMQQKRSLLIHDRGRKHAAGFSYLAKLLEYRIESAPESDAQLFKDQIIDFLEGNLLIPGPRGTIVGQIFLARHALEMKYINNEQFIKHVLMPASRYVLAGLDSPWVDGHDPRKLNDRESSARVELLAILQSLSLLMADSETSVKEFLLTLFYHDPTLEFDFDETMLDQNGYTRPILSLKPRRENGLLDIFREVTYFIMLPKGMRTVLMGASRKFKEYFDRKDRAGAQSYLSSLICENQLRSTAK